ncbi:MAG TPA: hypothetical protein VHU18_07420 [Rhizomicrobium sp.]|nr:hypothetical protein [Rhizomicrobium sp.]
MSINDVAISVFFGLCVPTVSDGRLEQTFSPERVVPLTDEDRELYDLGKWEAWKIQTDIGFVAFEPRDGWCRVLTCEGDPKEALQLFRRQIADLRGWEEGIEMQGDGYERVNAMIPLCDGFSVAALLVAEIENPDAGFVASAILVRGTENG